MLTNAQSMATIIT